MGCSVSRLEGSDVVLRCKNRRQALHEALISRDKFALAHISYLQSLAGLGSVLCTFAGDDSSNSQLPLLCLTHSGETSPPPSSSLSTNAVALSQPLAFSSSSSLSSPSSPSSPVSHPLPLQSPTISSLCPEEAESSSDAALRPALSIENILQTLDKTPQDATSTFYSPTRESYFSAFGSPPSWMSMDLAFPLSPGRNEKWDFLDVFEPPPIPLHLQEHRKMKHVKAVIVAGRNREENAQELDYDIEQDGLPDLEEEEENEKDEQSSKKEGCESFYKDEDGAVRKNSLECNDLVSYVDNGIEKKDLSAEDDKRLVVLSISEGFNLVKVVKLVNEQFIRASKSGRDVAVLIESQNVDPRFADSVKAMNAMAWYRPPSKMALTWTNEMCGSEREEKRMAGRHASTMESLHAWEKKLFDEVKAGEIIRLSFDRKCKRLQVWNGKGQDCRKLDRTQATLRNLDTQLMVALRAVHSASQQILTLMNDELLPQMSEIVSGLQEMWRIMQDCHKLQKAITLQLSVLEKPTMAMEGDGERRRATLKLEQEMVHFRNCFSDWLTSQQFYLEALQSWSRLCNLQMETDRKGPPILLLAMKWQQSLKRLQPRADIVTNAVESFVAILHSSQSPDLSNDWKHKTEEASEKHSVALSKRHKNPILTSIRVNLPLIFDALATFADSALQEYESLRREAEEKRLLCLENSKISEQYVDCC